MTQRGLEIISAATDNELIQLVGCVWFKSKIILNRLFYRLFFFATASSISLLHLLKMTCEEETPPPARLTVYSQSAGDGLTLASWNILAYRPALWTIMRGYIFMKVHRCPAYSVL